MRPRARAVAGLGALVSLLCLVAASPAAAQTSTPPPSSTTPSPSTTSPAAPSAPAPPAASAPPSTTPLPTDGTDPEAYKELAATVSKNTIAIAQLAAQINQSAQRLAVFDAAIADTTQKRDALDAQITQLKNIVRARAAFIYRRANSPELAIVTIQHVEDLEVGEKYAESATYTDANRLADLNRQAAALQKHLDDLQAQRATEQANKDQLDASHDNLVAITEKAKQTLDRAGNIPVMGDAQLTAQQIVDWFDSTGAQYQLAQGTSIDDLVQLYMEEGAAEHVRPELAFAQAIIETGSFGHALDNNFAGIGACDSCTGEIAFPTPRDGVRGQIQLLRNFADPSSRASNLANPPSPEIFGSDPTQAAVSFDNYVSKGQIPTWNLMGNGNWATDPNYAPKVLTVYFEMVSFAAHHSSS
jgi:flagellum-specific peptidoglycan hydrolase FlgJ